jgi:PilZ domain
MLCEDGLQVTNGVYNYGYRSPRYSADFRLLVHTLGGQPAVLDAHCTMLSEDGLAAEVNGPLEAGMPVTLTFTLPWTTAQLRIDSRVTNRQLNGYGFAFIGCSDQIQLYLRDYLEHQHLGAMWSPRLPR